MKGLAPKTQVELAKEVVERGYSAHRTEEAVQQLKRQAEREAEQHKADQAALEARRQVVDAGIAEQLAKGVDPDVVVIVASSYYYGSDTPVRLAR
jgi:predicted ATP-dependent protease